MTGCSDWRFKLSSSHSKTSDLLPTIAGKPKISYSVLKQLCSIEGLANIRNNETSNEAHDAFMKTYSKILKSDEKLPALDLKPMALTNGNGKLNNVAEVGYTLLGHRPAHCCSNYSSSISHNIRDHLAVLHKQRLPQTKDEIMSAKSRSLKKLLRKLPFERTRNDQENIFHHLQFFTELTLRISLKVLQELCAIVQLEKWNDAGYTVFGHNELYLIIKGSVARCDEKNIETLLKSPTEYSLLETEDTIEDTELEKKLVAGQCFGTLHSSESSNDTEKTNATSVSPVVTLEPCEFVKITARDFNKMKQLVDSKAMNQNLELMRSCRLFENCSKVALSKIVDIIRWKKFQPGAVLVAEGESCRVIGFISKGCCELKRTVDVAKVNRDGTKDRQQRQVIVGKLGPGDSFGECTVLQKQPISYSVVTSSHVQLGVISQHDFRGIDDVTKSLLSQCYEAMDKKVVEEDLQKQYIKQQKAEEWCRFKRNVVHDVIYYRSILPGYGKWSRNPTLEDVANLK